uniref:Uncharacterized protein n=1 Tax=Anguilla anguilla TaxID=7936 RepID=A0A0E9PPA5_ANGAN
MDVLIVDECVAWIMLREQRTPVFGHLCFCSLCV